LRTLLRMIIIGFGSLCVGILFNQVNRHGIRWHVLMYSLRRISHQQNFNYISADSAYALHIEGRGRFIDIRSYDDFLLDHIPGALSAPYFEILKRPDLLQYKSDDMAVVCYGFNPEDRKVRQVADLLKRKGFSKVFVLYGGFAEWIEMGYPVAKMDEQ
jgi:rhodanese-related sulfurtransferase